MLDGSPYPSTRIQLSKIVALEVGGIRRRHPRNLWFRGAVATSASHPGPEPGGDSRDRTGNLRLAKPALSQLSYIPFLLAVSHSHGITRALNAKRNSGDTWI